MPELPLSTRLVLRDRTHADAEVVLLTAVDDLVAAGAWRQETRRRQLVRLAHCLVPGDTLGDAPEPLPYVDGLLGTAHRQPGHKGTVEELAKWIAVHARSAPTTAVHRAMDDLVERGYLGRVATGYSHSYKPTERGESELAETPPREREPRDRKGKRRIELAYGGMGTLSPAVLGAWAAGADAGAGAANMGHGAHHHGGGGDAGVGHHGGHMGGHHGGHHGG